MQRLKRARLIAAAASAVASCRLLTLPSSAAQFSYKLAYADPPDTPAAVRMVQIAAAVKTETNGRLQIQLFPNSILGSPASMLAQVRIGSIQFFSSNHSSYASLVPVAQISSVGFAFTSSSQAFAAMDGQLGAYIRREFAAKGLYALPGVMESGFRQMTSSNKPFRTAEDLVGVKMRVLPAAIYVDLFKTLGAAPVPIDANEMYVAMQTHLVEGQENSFPAIETYKMYEVQKYLSVTNHIWGGNWITANVDAWNALPSDIQTILQRNLDKYTKIERNDMRGLTAALSDKLKRQGMVFNTADVSGMRARLGPYYSRWKGEFGNTAWSLLELASGKLG